MKKNALHSATGASRAIFHQKNMCGFLFMWFLGTSNKS